MKNLKLYIPFILSLLIFTAFLFSSCGTLKKTVQKSKEKEHTTTETKTAESASLTSQSATTRTILEETTVPFVTPADTVKASGTQTDLEGEGIHYEDDNISMTTKKDPGTGQITSTVITKGKTHKVPAKKTTIEDIKTSTTATVNTNTDHKIETKKEAKNKDVDKERDSGINWTLIIIIGVILILLFLWFLIWFYLPRRRRSE